MSDCIRFTIPAIPIAQPRQRHALFGGHIRNYTPSKHPVNDFKATARLAAAQAYQGPPLEGPLSMSVCFVFPRTKGETWKRREMPRIRHAKKPDRDNCEKSLMDSLRGLLFIDDAQVCAGEVCKWIAAGDEQPHVTVEVRRLP